MYHIAANRYERNLAAFTELLDLADLLDVPVRQLSLGQRMRGDIASALLHDPKILYLDEPTIGLDIVSKARLREFLRHVNATQGVTVLLTTHDLVDIEQLCTRVMVIDAGRLVYDGALAALHSLGGATRTLVVDLAEPTEPLRVHGAEVTRVDGPRQWLRFPADASAAPIVADIAARHDLADLSIHEPAIEEVITRLYQRSIR
jgi:ABC-2 type transport system ATP-binding protein